MVIAVGRRLLQTVPTLLLVSLVAFGLASVAPVDAARASLTAGGGAGSQIDEEALAAKRVELGLDRPLWERYVRWLSGVVRLDFGQSFVTRQPVSQLLADRLPASALLGGLALAMSVAISFPLGFLVAIRAGGVLDGLVRTFAVLGASLPGFWMALLLMWLFSVQLRWLPALGSLTPAGVVLPAVVLALRPLCRQLRLLRTSTLDALTADHLVVARSKGLPERTLLGRHVLPHAALPLVTVLGLDLPALVASAVIVETVFAWPGIGRMSADAALAGDIPVLMAFVMVAGVLVAVCGVLADLASLALDPRLRGQPIYV